MARFMNSQENPMSQTEMIAQHLKSGKSITPIDALKKFGCFRLGARIWDLRRMGYAVESLMIKRNGKFFSCYFMPRKEGLKTKTTTE